jgi:hypothetical protein
VLLVGVRHDAGLIGLVVLFVVIAVFALDVAGVILVVRRKSRLRRAARGAIGGVAVLTVTAGIVIFFQNASDLVGSAAVSAFVVLYGLIGCGAIFVLDSVVRWLRRPKPLSV